MDYVSILTKDMLSNRCSRTIHLAPETFNVRTEQDTGAAGVRRGPAVGMVINADEDNSANVPESKKLTQDTSLDTATLADLTDPKPQHYREKS